MYTLSFELELKHYEAFMKHHAVPKQRIVGIVGLIVILSVMYFISKSLVNTLFETSISPLWLMSFGGLVVIIAYPIMLKKINTKLIVANLDQKVSQTTIVFDEDTFRITGIQQGQPIDRILAYQVVRYMVITKALLLLYVASNQAILIPIESLPKASDFMDFLKERISIKV